MGCGGGCSCSHGSTAKRSGPGRGLFAVVGLVAGAAVLIGAAVALQPGEAPATEPAKTPAPAAADPKDQTAKSTEPATPPAAEAVSPMVMSGAVKRLDGAAEDLAQYKGRVVLIVNVASKCGLTPQYAGLQRLYESKKDQGLVILGFPSNDFRGQEPGTSTEIAEFCTKNYGVTFPMFEKAPVTGDQAAPLYRQLAAQPEPLGGEPKWNFTKFLVDRSGNVVARFEPRVAPDDAALMKKVDELLAAKPSAG